jgi:hypothetical protein
MFRVPPAHLPTPLLNNPCISGDSPYPSPPICLCLVEPHRAKQSRVEQTDRRRTTVVIRRRDKTELLGYPLFDRRSLVLLRSGTIDSIFAVMLKWHPRDYRATPQHYTHAILPSLFRASVLLLYEPSHIHGIFASAFTRCTGCGHAVKAHQS